MPLFVFIGHDVANSDALRAQHRPSHLARLKALQMAQQLVLAGPTPISHTRPTEGMAGSLIVADFADEQTAQAWADAEPYLLNGVYSHMEMRPFVQVLP